MNKREISKQNTRAMILEKTRELIAQKGVMGLATAVIAAECGIAHGSIFQHFGDRETLINTVLETGIKRIVLDIENRCIAGAGLHGLLDSCLEVLSREEDFLSVVYRELPFLPDGVQRNMIALEAVLRNTFYMSIEETSNGKMDGFELTLRLDAFFATVLRYLTLRQYYSPDGHVITSRAKDIRLLFKILFEGVDIS